MLDEGKNDLLIGEKKEGRIRKINDKEKKKRRHRHS